MLFENFRLNRALKRAVELHQESGVEVARASLEPWREKHGAELDVLLAEELADAGEKMAALALVERALSAAPGSWNGRVLLADLCEDADNFPRALATYRSMNAEKPTFEPLALTLAALELGHGDCDRAVRVLEVFGDNASFKVRKLLGTALFSSGQSLRAREVVSPLVEFLEGEMRRGFSGGVDPAEYQELKNLLHELVAETEGAEAVVGDALRRGQLDPSSGHNFMLLAGEVMNRSDRVAEHLELRTVEATVDSGKALLAQGPESAPGLCLVGIGALRRGDDGRALEAFEKARAVDPTYFPGWLGAGAARKHAQEGHYRAAASLPAPTEWPGLLVVVPDWAALTEHERRVVCASVEPLRSFLQHLAANEARIHVLPLDVRIVDRPEFKELLDARADDDHRSYAALGGIEGHGVACARIESLLDVSETGWTFAHEFAHLAHRWFAGRTCAEIDALYDEATSEENGWEFGQYALTNPQEFFACAYVEAVRARHAPREVDPLAPDGVARKVRDFIERMSAEALQRARDASAR